MYTRGPSESDSIAIRTCSRCSLHTNHIAQAKFKLLKALDRPPLARLLQLGPAVEITLIGRSCALRRLLWPLLSIRNVKIQHLH